MQLSRRSTTLVCLAASLSACTSWQRAAEYDGWTLYEMPGEAVSVDAYTAAFDPAFALVADALGPFEEDVRVHAWHGSVRVSEEGRTRVHEELDTGVHDVPGIGPARIQAYHARGGGGPFSRSGVFIGVPDPGTAVHELVHARLAELEAPVPLWFEEGVATLLGDGLLVDGRWVVDGLACWPLRELREEDLDDDTLAHLMSLTAADETSVRDNVLVHFLGWAVVFDLYRETGTIDWRAWMSSFDGVDDLAEVRRRLDRTLAQSTERTWLYRLDSPDRDVRLATAKGVWKLRSREVLDALLRRLEIETDTEVRVGLAINALAAAGELSLSWRRWRRAEQAVSHALRSADLPDAREQRALLDLYRAQRREGEPGSAQGALRRLGRFWEE